MSIEGVLLVAGLLCLAIAFVAGGPEERIFVAAQAVSGLTEHFVVRSGDIVAAVLVDLGVLAVVLPIALRTTKVWPLIAASLCVASLMSEAAQLMVHASPDAYGLMQASWDLIADLMVAGGAAAVWRAGRTARQSV